MDTAFVIGNGESRNIFPIETLRGKGTVWGCNAIYRDHPELCDHIVGVSPEMTAELQAWKSQTNTATKIYSMADTVDWDWIIPGDKETDIPEGLKLYRIWRGGNAKNGGKIRTNDFITTIPLWRTVNDEIVTDVFIGFYPIFARLFFINDGWYP